MLWIKEKYTAIGSIRTNMLTTCPIVALETPRVEGDDASEISKRWRDTEDNGGVHHRKTRSILFGEAGICLSYQEKRTALLGIIKIEQLHGNLHFVQKPRLATQVS